jgi:hypothetical protein
LAENLIFKSPAVVPGIVLPRPRSGISAHLFTDEIPESLRVCAGIWHDNIRICTSPSLAVTRSILQRLLHNRFLRRIRPLCPRGGSSRCYTPLSSRSRIIPFSVSWSSGSDMSARRAEVLAASWPYLLETRARLRSANPMNFGYGLSARLGRQAVTLAALYLEWVDALQEQLEIRGGHFELFGVDGRESKRLGPHLAPSRQDKILSP